MLAGKADLKKLKYPLYASPKLDGVRGLVHNGVLRSRSWKEFPNEHTQEKFSLKVLNGFDGELILGEPTDPSVYRLTNSALQRESGKPKVWFYVFDIFNSKLPFEKRMEDLFLRKEGLQDVVAVEQIVINNETELNDYEEAKLNEGYEGVILRNPNGLYKHGRATSNSQELLKLKRFEDSEAEIVSVFEEMHNGNEAKKDAFGRTERSSHKANLVGKGRLGGFTVRDVHTGVVFDIGSGFTAEEREQLWAVRNRLPGKIIKYKFFAVGVKDKPRHPVYLGPREAWDM